MNPKIIRMTLVKLEDRYFCYINFSRDVPKLGDARLISTESYSPGVESKQTLIDFGKSHLRQSLHDFNRNIKFDEIEFVELAEN